MSRCQLQASFHKLIIARLSFYLPCIQAKLVSRESGKEGGELLSVKVIPIICQIYFYIGTGFKIID